jgi:hypothetical protein
VEVSYGEIKLTFRRSKNRDFRVREGLVTRLKTLYPGAFDSELRLFGRLVSQVEGGVDKLPFALPTLESDDEQIRVAFECWQEMDEEFGNACWAALEQLTRPADVATGPDPLPEDAQKNA